jgi:hypothetical protein
VFGSAPDSSTTAGFAGDFFFDRADRTAVARAASETNATGQGRDRSGGSVHPTGKCTARRYAARDADVNSGRRCRRALPSADPNAATGLPPLKRSVAMTSGRWRERQPQSHGDGERSYPGGLD